MIIKRNKEIYWGEFRGASFGVLAENSFLYGSVVIYHSRDHVYFENSMVNSGTMIHEWTSSFNFQGNRLTPTLPLLKRDHRYRLVSQMTVYFNNEPLTPENITYKLDAKGRPVEVLNVVSNNWTYKYVISYVNN